MIVGKSTVKLIDFGSAKHLSRNKKTDTWIGTPLFVAPEITKNLKYDFSCDIWSLGVLLYYSLTGKYPIDAETAKGVVRLIKK